MPAFSFEKLPPPIDPRPAPAPAVKHRGIIVQMLDRLTEARLRRASGDIANVDLQGRNLRPDQKRN